MTEFEFLKTLLEKDRTIRRFDASREVNEETLERLIELTRYCASGRNLQPLVYKLINAPAERESVFPLIAWAGYLPDWEGPVEEERPAAYIIQCLDTRLTRNCLCDDGLQLQAITMGAVSLGLGCCIIKSFNIARLREVADIPDWAEIRYVVAIGYPREKVVIEDFEGDVKYYRTPDAVHHVPKRPLDSLLLKSSGDRQ